MISQLKFLCVTCGSLKPFKIAKRMFWVADRITMLKVHWYPALLAELVLPFHILRSAWVRVCKSSTQETFLSLACAPSLSEFVNISLNSKRLLCSFDFAMVVCFALRQNIKVITLDVRTSGFDEVSNRWGIVNFREGLKVFDFPITEALV